MPNGGDIVMEYFKEAYRGYPVSRASSIIGFILKANPNIRFIGTAPGEEADVMLLIFERAWEIIGQPLQMPKQAENIIIDCSEEMAKEDGSAIYASRR